jgi:uncharacterized protein YegL
MKRGWNIIIFLLFNFFFISIVSSATTPENNPPQPATCGLDIILVIDVSGSIDGSEYKLIEEAYHNFTKSFLVDVPNSTTKFSIVMFGSSAAIQIENSDDLIAINNAISNRRTDIGSRTNFKDALIKVQNIPDLRPSVTNIVIFASDGLPNLGGGDYVNEADKIKLSNGGTRIVTLGIGPSADINCLKSISGPNVDTGDLGSDVLTSSFQDLSEALAQYAYILCLHQFSVPKAELPFFSFYHFLITLFIIIIIYFLLIRIIPIFD